MDSSVFACVEDLRGESFAAALDRIAGEYGVTGLTVAAAYHRARDVTPHGRARVTVRCDGAHFEPAEDLFAGTRLRPPVQPGASDQPLRSLRRATAERGLALHGWTVFCHSTTLGTAHPDCTSQNAFGDRAAPADLCPSHPDVQAYAIALARNVARHGVDTVVAESLHFGFFDHGYHHERSFAPLGEIDRFLLGLCFCPACRAAAARRGADPEAARTASRQVLERVLGSGQPSPGGLSLEGLGAVCGPAVGEYAAARAATVTGLAARVAEAVAAEGSRLVFLDLTGAIKGYADGMPAGAPAARDAWRIGTDPGALGRQVPEYAVLGYARDPARVASDVAAYREALGPVAAAPALRVVLRPCLPDTGSAGNLTEKVTAACRAGATAVDFYHDGLAPLPALRRIPEALRGSPGTPSRR
jgi:hypothetical protein